MTRRGTYDFEVNDNQNVKNTSKNFEKLRSLFLDGNIIDGRYGPGRDSSDFKYGGWHVLCHLVAGGIVYKQPSENLLWVAITHDMSQDQYRSTVTYRSGLRRITVPLESSEGQKLIDNAIIVGYVEGNSKGHISARSVKDPKEAFNKWPRQKYNRSIWSPLDGGKVWEHWCTTRDIRKQAVIGSSVLSAYLYLVSTVGGQFVATVARGRNSHDHPIHICAMVKAGLITRNDALYDTFPVPIPKKSQRLFYEARPRDSLKAVEKLDWFSGDELKYYMFIRKINKWNKTENVRKELQRFRI